MRTIGNLASEEQASGFRDHLLTKGIELEIEAEDDNAYSLWVLDEDQLPAAVKLLEEFRAKPQIIDFQAAAAVARKQRATADRADRNRRSTVVDTARIGYEQHVFGVPYLTLGFIVVCVAVAIYTQLGKSLEALSPLLITEYMAQPGSAPGMPYLPEVLHGQVWRLLSPIFVHFDLLHIFFNVMVLKDLGTFIETRFGSPYFVALVVVFGVLSNLGQAVWGHPLFGGMSGVNYALLGFLWIRGRFDRNAAWQLNPTTVQMMLIWFVLCLVGVFGNIANTAHAVGLVAGMAWGYLSSGRVRFSR